MWSGGRPLGRHHDECALEARMSMAWVPGSRRHMCPKAPRRSLRIVVVKGGCPVRIRIALYKNIPFSIRSTFCISLRTSTSRTLWRRAVVYASATSVLTSETTRRLT